jgi:membrane-associated phospholipid phosphatase
VASGFAVALVLLHFSLTFGLIFLFVAVWISLGAVVGRYHYALDVLLGAITALAVYLACYDFLT